jgi:hypothetical protein
MSTIQVTPGTSLNTISQAITIGTWVKFNNIATTHVPNNNWQSILTKLEYSDSYGLMLQIGCDSTNCDPNKLLRFYHLGSGGGTDSPPNPGIIQSQWHYIVSTFDGAQAYIYIDGKQVTKRAVSGNIPPNTKALCIGCTGNGRAYFLNGEIADLRIYNRALTASEVQELSFVVVEKPIISASPTNLLFGQQP